MSGTAQDGPGGYRIREARASDLASLPEIESEAARLFVQLGLDAGVLADGTTAEELETAHEAGRLWVAAGPEDEPVGFAYLEALEGYVLLGELDVHPDHGRRGIGAALVRAVCREAGARPVVLTTFREVPWNAPFYRRLGFRELPPGAWSPGIRKLVEDEDRKGLSKDERLVMIRPGDGAGSP